MKVEINHEAVDSIVVQSLKEQYKQLTDDLEDRYINDNTGVFHSNKEEDIVAIKKMLNNLENVLEYNMTEEDYNNFFI